MAKILLDTNVILDYPDIFDNLNEEFIIHNIVCEEIDNIIHNSLSEEKKYKARQARNAIKNAINKIYSIHSPTFSMPIGWDMNKNDNNLLRICKDLDCILYTNDLAMQIKADAIGVEWREYEGTNNTESYLGYKEVTLTEYEQAIHYECPINKWDLLNGEYLIIKNEDGSIIDKQCWIEGKGFRAINSKPFKSLYFGDIKPKDVYQQLAIDSLYNSQFTLLTGYAGTAKTLLSLGWIMQNLQTGKIGKCVIIFNPAKLKNNEQLGYYSGDRTQKLLQNSIGGILSSKLGDMSMVETLINQGKIMVIPTSDIRGIEISDNDVLFVSEAQNTDAYTMKTIIQRAKDGCKIIIEGDMEEQTDIRCTKKDNGMQRVIDVFKGSLYFSCIRLQKIYRSPIAELAQNI